MIAFESKIFIIISIIIIVIVIVIVQDVIQN